MATRRISQNSFATTLDASVSFHDQDLCAICLGVPENRSFANNCLHEFCFACLLKWSKVRAECPICIQFFSSIIHSVKSDQDYQELQITGLPQPVPRVIPGTILPGQLQQPGIQPLGLPIQSEGQAVASSSVSLTPLLALRQQTALFNQATTALQQQTAALLNQASTSALQQQATALLNQASTSALQRQTTALLNQASTSAFAVASVSFVRPVREHALHLKNVAKQTPTLMPTHSAAPQTYKQEHAAQINLEAGVAPLSHREESNRYLLRPKAHRTNIPDRASNAIQLVNEFCPLNSSTPLRPFNLELSQVVADPVQKSKWWHGLVSEDMRSQMVQELVQALNPMIYEKEFEIVVAYMRETESVMYQTAESKQHYTLIHSDKIKEFKTGMDLGQKRKFIQRILSSESLALDRPLDLSSPRTKNTGLGNRNAPGAHIQQQIGVPIFENYEDENDEGNQIEMVFSDESNEYLTAGSSSSTESSLVEEGDDRVLGLQQSAEDDSHEIVVLEIPPKREPELIILSDSDDE